MNIFIDTETGGTDPRVHEILQIAWKLADDQLRPVEDRHGHSGIKNYYLPMTLPATEKALKINGLTNQFLEKEATGPEEVYRALVSDMENCSDVYAHNLPFDRSMLEADAARRLGHDHPFTVAIKQFFARANLHDTKRDYAQLRREWLLRTYPGPYLDELCRHLGIRTDSFRFHDARSDVNAMCQCVKEIKHLYIDTII